MKRRNKRIVYLFVVFCFLLSLGKIAAESWTTGYVSVPSGGRPGYTEEYNIKQNESRWAGFWGDSLPNAFGYTVALVNYGKYIRSDTVELRKLETTWADNNSGKPGYYYYARVNSKFYEPNWSRIALQFTAAYDTE